METEERQKLRDEYKRRASKLDSLISASNRYESEFGNKKDDPIVLELERMASLRFDKNIYAVARTFYFLESYYKDIKIALEGLGIIYGRIYSRRNLALTRTKSKDHLLDQVSNEGLPRLIEFLKVSTTRLSITRLAKEGYLREKK